MALASGGEIRGGEGVPGPGRIDVVERPHVDAPDASVGEDERPVEPERHDHLRDAEARERGLVEVGDERERLLLGELQDRDVLEHGRVVVGAQLERSPPWRPDEPLPVEGQPAPPGELGQRLRGEVALRKRRDVQRADPPERGADVVGRPRIPDRVDLHQTRVAVVAHREGVRRLGVPHGHGHAERGQPRNEHGPIRAPALRQDPRRPAEDPERAAAVVGAAADPRRPSLNAIEGEAPDYRDRSHAASLTGRAGPLRKPG